MIAPRQLQNIAHNSTRAGVPLPITVSKLSGTSSTTFEALTAAQRAARNKEKEGLMVQTRVGYVSLMSPNLVVVSYAGTHGEQAVER